MNDRPLVDLEEQRVAAVRPGENADLGLEDDRPVSTARLAVMNPRQSVALVRQTNIAGISKSTTTRLPRLRKKMKSRRAK